MKMTEQKVRDDLAAHNVARVEIKFEGQMIRHDTDLWRFEPEKDGWLIKVEDTAGKVLSLDDGLYLDDLDFGDDLYSKEIEDHLGWYVVKGALWGCGSYERAEQEGETAKGTILINVEARTVSITGTKQTMAVVTKPFENTRKVEDKETAAA